MSRKVLSPKCVGHREQLRYLFSATLTDTPSAEITSRNSVGGGQISRRSSQRTWFPHSNARDSALSPTATQTAVADAVTSVVDAGRQGDVPGAIERLGAVLQLGDLKTLFDGVDHT